jgi:hypothetical protein
MAEEFAALPSDIHHFGRLATYIIFSVLGLRDSPANHRAILRSPRDFCAHHLSP